MSSQIPTRRATRATRLQDENAVKGKQPATRGVAKPGGVPAVTGSSKPAGNTALDTHAQNKRKREALGEVTNNNKNKNILRGVSKDGKLGKPAVVITKPAPRPTATVRQTRASAAAAAAQKPDLPETTTATATTRRGTLNKRVSTASRPKHVVDTEEQVDNEEYRATKRRRTSSETGEEDAEVEVEIAAASPSADCPASPVEVTPKIEEEEVTGWDDLDKDDFDDPLMVSEYVIEIFKYLSECEDQTLPNPNYMQHQAELRWSQRAILMDFLIGLHQQFRLCPETLYLAVNLVDRFLSMRVVSLVKLQLVGLASLFIAAKYEEIVAPSAQHYIKAAAVEDEVKQEDVLKAEKYILKILNYTVSLYPQPMNWLRRISKADDYDPQVRTVAKYFLEIHVVERRLLGVKPSLLAAASIWLARLVLNHTDWTPNLAHYSGYSENKIIPVANIMLNYCLRVDKHEHFQQKYASRKFSKASVFVNDWVTARWTLGNKISLVNELPFVKELAQQRAALDSS